MKTIFTLLLSTLFTLAAMAYDATRLTISSISTNKMNVEVDGQRYKMDAKGIYIHDLRTGYHTVKIYRDVKKKNGRLFDFGRNNQETVYNNRIYLKEGFHYDILINRFGKTLLDERRIDRNDDWYNDEDDNGNNVSDRDNRDYDRNRDLENNRDNRDNRDNRENRDSRDNKDNRDNRDNRDNGDNQYNNNSRSMDSRDFNQAKETLRNEWFENTRVTSAKQIISANYFTSQQVKELLQLFTFENNKLELAKLAYSRSTDRNNYYLVNDVFTYSNSKDELARYIRDYR